MSVPPKEKICDLIFEVAFDMQLETQNALWESLREIGIPEEDIRRATGKAAGDLGQLMSEIQIRSGCGPIAVKKLAEELGRRVEDFPITTPEQAGLKPFKHRL